MYYIEVTANTCRCSIICNGLGICELDATHTGSIQYPCNTELIGMSNNVEVKVVPASLDPATLDKIHVSVMVKRYGDNEIMAPESGDEITFFTLDESIEKVKANPFVNIADLVPFTVSGMFDTEEAPSFADRLTQAPVIDTPELLMKWAMDFRSKLEKQDVDGLYGLYEPKLGDYDRAYPLQKEPDNKEWFAGWMRNKIFPQIPFTDFTRDDVELVKWCDGRVWEIRLKDGGPLWRTIGKDGKRTTVDVYVGMVDKKIRIVR